MKKLFILSALFFFSLYGEVKQVTIIWDPGLCWDACIQTLHTQFLKINGVADVHINQGTGRAEIKWKPETPFSFAAINAALRFVGVRQRDIRLQVRGRVIFESGQYKLLSSGDNTSFTLFNPIIPQQRNYVEQFNPAARQLTPENEEALKEIKSKNLIITVEGPLYEPFRSPPYRLVLERYGVDKK
jgi:hypothetical protein